MATNKTKSLKELMEAQAFTWAGATDDANTKIFIWANFADMYTFILEEIDDETEGHKLKVYHLDSLKINTYGCLIWIGTPAPARKPSGNESM